MNINLNNDSYLDLLYGDHYGFNEHQQQMDDHLDSQEYEQLTKEYESIVADSMNEIAMNETELFAKHNYEAYRAYTKEEMIMTTTTTTMGATKQEIRTMIEAMDHRFVISNTAFKQIKKELLEALHVEAKNILDIMKEENVQETFNTYVQLAVRGNVFPLVKVEHVDASLFPGYATSKCYAQRSQVGAYVLNSEQNEAASNCSCNDCANDCTKCPCFEDNIALTDASAASITPQASAPEVEASAPIQEEVLMKETAAQKIARLEAAVLELESKLVLARTIYKEMNAELKGYRASAVVAPVVTPVVLAPPVVTPAVKGQGRYSKEEMEAMRLRAMNGTHVVVASNDVVTGAYTKAEVQVMKQAANRTAELCACGTHLTKQNINYLSQAKVQAAMPVPYKGVLLCFHCQQSVLGGSVPFTAEQRKAGEHKSVKRVVIK